MDEWLDVENMWLNELLSQFVVVQVFVLEFGSCQSVVGVFGDCMQEVLNSLLIVGLKLDFLCGEVWLKELSVCYGDLYLQVIEMKVNNEEVCWCIEVEMQKIMLGVIVNNSINQQWVVEFCVLFDVQCVKIQQMKVLCDEVFVLVCDVENVQWNYDMVQ